MKLRNKKTGEVGYLIVGKGSYYYHVCDDGWSSCGKYLSLAELNEEWEDAPEESKDYWYIGWNGKVYCSYIHDEETEQMKLIGNYFETKEEAEKAVEKLKAWKRLKDKGFRFVGITETVLEMDCVEFKIGEDFYKEQSIRNSELNKDLDLLFGGEE